MGIGIYQLACSANIRVVIYFSNPHTCDRHKKPSFSRRFFMLKLWLNQDDAVSFYHEKF